MRSLFRKLNFLINFIFPSYCIVCGKTGAVVCPECEIKLPWNSLLRCPYCFNPSFSGRTHFWCQEKTPLSGLLYSFYYTGVIQKAIKKIKYRGVYFLGEKLVELALSKHDSGIFRGYTIIPIPLHPKRLRERGFNQAEIIARELGKTWNLVVDATVLRRKKETTSQVALSREQRIINVRDAFEVTDKCLVKGKNIILVDDVCTSGATLLSGAKALKKSGAESIWGFTLAHGSN